MSGLISFALLISVILSLTILIGLVIWYLRIYIFGLPHKQLSARLDALVIQTKGFSRVPSIDFVVKKNISLLQKLDQSLLIQLIRNQIEKSGLNIQVRHILIGAILVVVSISTTTLIFSQSFALALLLGVIGCAIPYAFLSLIVKRRQAHLQRQLPDLMDFMARSLQVGHSLSNTLQMAAHEAPSPISAEFQRVFEELNYGAPIQKVLSELSNRIDCPEVRYFAIAVIVNREIGGDLAEILKRVSKLIRERMDMQQTIRVLSSEGRASALVLGALPFVIGGLIFFIQPNSYKLMLNDPLGQNLLLYAGLLMFAGFVWMNRLCTLKQ